MMKVKNVSSSQEKENVPIQLYINMPIFVRNPVDCVVSFGLKQDMTNISFVDDYSLLFIHSLFLILKGIINVSLFLILKGIENVSFMEATIHWQASSSSSFIFHFFQNLPVSMCM